MTEHTEQLTERLTDTQRTILDMERSWWRHVGAKETAIRERTGLSVTGYFAALNALLDNPAAMAEDPMTVRRLRRMREARQRQRSARRLGWRIED